MGSAFWQVRRIFSGIDRQAGQIWPWPRCAAPSGTIQYLNGGNWSLAREFTEVESGKRNERVELGESPRSVQTAKSQVGHRQAGPAVP